MTCSIVSSGEEVYLTAEERQVLKQRISGLLLSLLSQGYTDFYLNCNYGVPLWTAELLCVFKKKFSLKLHIAAPHEEQCAHWKECHRKRYMAIHAQADSVTFVSSPHDSDCYLCADEYMADRSNLILVYDTQNIGLYIVDYAVDIGVQVQYI